MEGFENMDFTPEVNKTPETPTQEFQPREFTAPVQEPVQIPVQETPYHHAGVGRKESPFADSPYVMNHNLGANTYASQPDAPKQKKGTGKKVFKGILSAVLVLALIAAGCGITASVVNDYWQVRMDAMETSMEQQINALEKQIESLDAGVSVSGSPVAVEGVLTPGQVYAMNADAVVAISSKVSGSQGYGMSAGSGFILSADGYVATNYHVIEGATSVSVITNDGEEYDAKIVGSNATNDLAVLKIEDTDLPYVTIGSSNDLIVGDQVVAVGNALGELSSSMTVGYISGKDRDVNTDGVAINMLQTDAAINSGNSGGPLFNMKGEVVGITTAKYSGTTTSGASIEGIGFAIPIDDVVGMISDLTQFGYITGAYLGVLVTDMDPAVSESYGLPMGAYVKEATEGYCAKAAGVQAKDIIVALGEYPIEGISDLTRALRNFKAGETTTITVFRAGAEVVLTITLDEKPIEEAETVQETPAEPQESVDPYGFLFPFFGGNG